MWRATLLVPSFALASAVARSPSAIARTPSDVVLSPSAVVRHRKCRRSPSECGAPHWRVSFWSDDRRVMIASLATRLVSPNINVAVKLRLFIPGMGYIEVPVMRDIKVPVTKALK